MGIASAEVGVHVTIVKRPGRERFRGGGGATNAAKSKVVTPAGIALSFFFERGVGREGLLTPLPCRHLNPKKMRVSPPRRGGGGARLIVRSHDLLGSDRGGRTIKRDIK